MKNPLKNLLYGCISWAIPFVASFPFFTREGKLLIDEFLFKNIMLVVGAVTGMFLLLSYFKKIKGNYFKEGIIVGASWLVINLLLDVLIFFPMSGMTISKYFIQIGSGYFIIPIMCVMVGAALANREKRTN